MTDRRKGRKMAAVFVSPGVRPCRPECGTPRTARGWTAGGSAKMALPRQPAEAGLFYPGLYKGVKIRQRSPKVTIGLHKAYTYKLLN